jgi:hypothetical protein
MFIRGKSRYRRVRSGFFKLDWELIILLKTDWSDFPKEAKGGINNQFLITRFSIIRTTYLG